MSANALQRWAQIRTLTGLLAGALVFTLNFGAFGLVLREFGVSLTAYPASASILGLAIGFGPRGVVQDMVCINSEVSESPAVIRPFPSPATASRGATQRGPNPRLP